MLSVTALNKYIKALVEEDVLLEAVAISGEISNFTLHSSGHLYFSLKDEHSSISCVMWRDVAAALKFKPENGMDAVVFGRVAVYEKQGRYQLYAELMEDAGRGRLHAMFEALKAKLAKKGYFDEFAKKPIPAEVKTIALVTSPTGAAIRDMIKIAGELDPAVKLIVVPCLVQGDGAAASISASIDRVNRWGKADAMIVGRGGGSMEDLWPFNEEVVADAIFRSNIPIISAVGHETDFTIADFTADMRASTPSFAISMLIKPREIRYRKLSALSKDLERLCTKRLYDYENKLSNLINSRGFQKPAYLHSAYVNRLKNAARFLNLQMSNHEERTKAGALNLFARLEEASPVKVMKKGYSVATAKGKAIKSVNDISVGENLKVILSDGSLETVVSKINLGDGLDAEDRH